VDQTNPLMTWASIRTREVSKQGLAPYTVIYAAIPSSRSLDSADRMARRRSDRDQCRHARHPPRPDQAADHELADLISPEFKGKAALQDQPSTGVIDVAMAMEASGTIKYATKAI